MVLYVNTFQIFLSVNFFKQACLIILFNQNVKKY